MGLPRNYQEQETQLKKRFDSLRDLNYYTVDYEYKFTKKFKEENLEKLKKEEWSNLDVKEWGTPRSFEHFNVMFNSKDFSALDDEQAEIKITEWLDKQIENNIISEYDIKSFNKRSFYDVLKDKGLLPFVELK